MESLRDETGPNNYHDAGGRGYGYGRHERGESYTEGSQAYPNTYEGYEQGHGQESGSDGYGYEHGQQPKYAHDAGYGAGPPGQMAFPDAGGYVNEPAHAISRDPLNQYP